MLKEGLDVKTNEGSFSQSADFLMESFTLMTSSPPLITEILKMTSKGKIFVHNSVADMSLVESTNTVWNICQGNQGTKGVNASAALTLGTDTGVT